MGRGIAVRSVALLSLSVPLAAGELLFFQGQQFCMPSSTNRRWLKLADKEAIFRWLIDAESHKKRASREKGSRCRTWV
jgi:hypothetical protein